MEGVIDSQGSVLTAGTRSDLNVYFDKARPSSWISRETSHAIAAYLSKQGFDVLSAPELAQWMARVCGAGSAQQSAVVFSQDVLPHELVRNITPNDLLRRYLHSGGRVVWIGDIPCWLRSNPSNPKDKEEIWRQTGPLLVLGFWPVVAVPTEPVRVIGLGHRYISDPWYGIRPIVPADPSAAFFLALARSRTVVARFIYLRPVSLRERVWGWLRGLVRTVNVGPLSLGVGTDAPEPALVVEGRTLTNAWILRFKRSDPSSGFVRLWDFPLEELTDSMLATLTRAARGNDDHT